MMKVIYIDIEKDSQAHLCTFISNEGTCNCKLAMVRSEKLTQKDPTKKDQ